jgi:hypothetical protein
MKEKPIVLVNSRDATGSREVSMTNECAVYHKVVERRNQIGVPDR